LEVLKKIFSGIQMRWLWELKIDEGDDNGGSHLDRSSQKRQFQMKFMKGFFVHGHVSLFPRITTPKNHQILQFKIPETSNTFQFLLKILFTKRNSSEARVSCAVIKRIEI
jgi:hypothetical protein